MKHPDFPMFTKSTLDHEAYKYDWNGVDSAGRLTCWVEPADKGWRAVYARNGSQAGPFDTAEQAMAYCVLMGWTQL